MRSLVASTVWSAIISALTGGNSRCQYTILLPVVASMSHRVRGVPQHDEQHAGRLRRVKGMRHTGGHSDNGTWNGSNRHTSDRDHDDALEHHDERVERGRVL